MDGATPRILTFGCRLNSQESEAMRPLVGDGSDLVVVNSCAVTGEAGRQARQAIRRIKRDQPHTRILVTGCGAEVEGERYAAMPEVEGLVGNGDKLTPAVWQRLRTGAGPAPASDIMAARGMVAPPVERFEGRARAFLQVQNGCDHRCTFCIIPFGRGPARSLAPEEGVAQARRLVAAGYAEIVLTGVDLTSYGDDLPGRPRLGDLVARILADVPDLQRLRLSSLDAVEVDAALLKALADEERLMPHLHLSLQAGHDVILKRMKRRHTRADAIRFCEEARRLRPDLRLGADMIAGFPTETEAMFAASLDLLDACGITHLHVFPFSPRPGTPAARMPPCPAPEIRARARRLREKGEAAFRACLDAEIGRLHPVLAERGGLARTPHFIPVRTGAMVPVGAIRRVRLTGHDGQEMRAEPAA
jgi:threonylcarbamoyladenosine tRNA methylthiotransferase MtaB